MEREYKDEQTASAWYAARGTMEATDRWNAALVEIYDYNQALLTEKRLENYESALKTIRDLIAQHAP
jgi:flagellin-specific chaperone FliS